jgi:hypothetical protein
MSRTPRPFLLALLLLAASAQVGTAASPAPAAEDEVLRQIKNDVFDERWDSVLADCERLIQAYPSSESLPRTYYYRAKALQHLPGRETDAVAAWSAFIDKFPSDPLLREDALISRMNLAKGLWLQGKRENITILTKGLEEKGYPRIYAAVLISNLDNKPARARALPVLQECSRAEKSAEVRNECTLAILRIDPSALPTPPPVPPAPGNPSATAPKLIRLEVRDKSTGSLTVAVNLPLAFAEALLGSLSEIDRGRVTEELKTRHIDLENLLRSLKAVGPQTLVEVETEDAKIRVWLE